MGLADVGRSRQARRICGWVLIGVGLALVVVWRAGWWWSVECRWCRASLQGSDIELMLADAEGRKQYGNWCIGDALVVDRRGPAPSWMYWTSDAVRLPSRVRIVRFPMWPLMVGALGLGAVLVWSARRRWVGQRRFVLGVCSASVGAGLAGLWALSGWRATHCDFAPLHLAVYEGIATADLRSDNLMRISFWLFARMDEHAVRMGTSGNWVLWWWKGEPGVVVAPVWPFALGFGVVAVPLVRSGLRAHRRGGGACTGCGYDLRGLGAGAVCPECGAGRLAGSTV